MKFHLRIDPEAEEVIQATVHRRTELVDQIEALGQPFDPERHEAVMHIDDEGFGENEVVQVFQAGFALGDKVIRHAVVQVAN